MKDRAKDRRGYLWKKAASYLVTAGGVLFFSGLFVVLLLAAILLLLPFYDSVFLKPVAIMAFIPAMACVAAVALNQSKRIAKKAEENAARYYAPPVDKANLPVAEMLLRGSDQPTAQPNQLLRSASGGIDAVSVELLRPDESQTI